MFQSTHSLRSATRRSFSGSDAQSVSIHALLAECDFYRICHAEQRPVSIHALLAECDQYVLADWRGGKSFNPRTPCGVRHVSRHASSMASRFQSTHSLRSATSLSSSWQRQFEVSIHALLAECDRNKPLTILQAAGFNPRTPCGVRHWTETAKAKEYRVSIHALLAECDLQDDAEQLRLRRFQSTHSLRSATAPDLIHCYSTKQIILCANLPKKTVIARLLFLSIYLSIFYSQCITPIADLPGNSCELEVGAQAMFNSL